MERKQQASNSHNDELQTPLLQPNPAPITTIHSNRPINTNNLELGTSCLAFDETDFDSSSSISADENFSTLLQQQGRHKQEERGQELNDHKTISMDDVVNGNEESLQNTYYGTRTRRRYADGKSHNRILDRNAPFRQSKVRYKVIIRRSLSLNVVSI